MDNMGLWLVIGAAVAIAGICVILLQKKAGEARKYFDELQILRNQAAERAEHNDAPQADDGAVKELQKKVDGLSATLQSAKDQNAALQAELSEAQTKLRQAEEKQERAEIDKIDEDTAGPAEDDSAQAAEIAALKNELEEKKRELDTVEERFEKQMEEVVQSSIQKISHAEQAKEEAIQAAQDNFEAAAEANARLKEKEELIKQLKG